MNLKWRPYRYSRDTNDVITEENVNDYHQAYADFGKFTLDITPGRQFKDETIDYICRLSVNAANGYVHEVTLARHRGHLLGAIHSAEKALFKYYNLPRMYRLPIECLDIDPAAKKLLECNALCFECDNADCAFNPDGVCMYPVLYGKEPNLETFDGCDGYLPRKEA